MNCHICGEEAVDRCYNCGELFCQLHGKINCIRCETGFMPGDRRADRISVVMLGKSARPGWWRPQEAEEYDPPACYQCKGLARRICRNCRNVYCPEHAGKGGLSLACENSARLGAVIFMAVALSIVALIAIGIFQPFLQQ